MVILMLDKEKMLRDMTARRGNLKGLILRDYNGDPSKLESQEWELKYWQEAIERGEYDLLDEEE
jgi:hypothetical protein